MANPSKVKGDRGELAAAAELTDLATHLTFTRWLGAGRKDDVGDLRCSDERVVVQVKTSKDTAWAIRESIAGALAQADNVPGSVWVAGIANVHGARGPVRRVVVALDWPGGAEQFDPIPTFGQPGAAIRHLRSGTPLVHERLRLVQVQRTGRPPVYLGTLACWLDCLEEQVTLSQQVA